MLGGLRGRTLIDRELPGFSLARGQVLETKPKDWLLADQMPDGQASREAARLRPLGFVAGAREDLVNGSSAGLSLVEQFRVKPTDRYSTFDEVMTAG